MKFVFFLDNAASNNWIPARLRESTRMVCIAATLRHLGCDVHIPEWPAYGGDRWPLFGKFGGDSGGDVAVVPAEVFARPLDFARVVGIKTSRDIRRDLKYVHLYDALIAHELNPVIAHRPNVLVSHWHLHRRAMQWIIDKGLLGKYLENNVWGIRRNVDPPADKKPRIIFCGTSQNGRKALAESIHPDIRKHIDFVWRNEPDHMPADDYMRLLASYDAGLHMPGDGPKTYRFAEMAMLGLTTVWLPSKMPECPPITQENAIPLASVNDVETFERLWPKRHSLRYAADDDYLQGWSWLGHANRLLNILGA